MNDKYKRKVSPNEETVEVKIWNDRLFDGFGIHCDELYSFGTFFGAGRNQVSLFCKEAGYSCTRYYRPSD